MANPPTDYYVDPSIAGNSGTGTIGDPYGDIQYALNTVTRDATDGDRFNIKAGTAEILSAALDLTTSYGTPAFTSPLIFQGYTSTQGDGGQGSIDCNNFVAITNAGTGINWYDMELHSGISTGDMLTLAQYSTTANCYFHGTNGTGLAASNGSSMVIGCRFEDLGDATHDMVTFSSSGSGRCINNYFRKAGTRTCRSAIRLGTNGMVAIGNIISIDGVSDGIVCTSFDNLITGNSILSSGGTGQGIDIAGSNAGISQTVFNNVIEGFSGTGGVGYNLTRSSEGGGFYGKNAAYNNATNYTVNSEHLLDYGDNEVLTISGFAKSGADTFANRFTYYEPVDTGNMQTGGFPEA